jgi:hypothetical protein
MFTLRGQSIELEKEKVDRALARVVPEPVTIHSVKVNGRKFPVKQALSVVLGDIGISRLDFTSADARSIFRRLGFELFETRRATPKRKGD